MKTEMPKDLKRWEETRKKGKISFILVNGLLAWGLPMFVVMTFFVNKKADRPLTPGIIAVSAAIWTLGGLTFGLVIWTLSEKKYQKFVASQTDEPSH